MALYNEILAGRFNRFLQKYLNMKGDAPSPQLAGEIIASHNFFTGVENRYLEQWEIFGQGVTSPGAAGNQSGFNLRNPSGSGIIAVIEKLAVSTGAAALCEIDVSSTATDLATVGTGQARGDQRQRGVASCVPSIGNAVSLGLSHIAFAFIGPNAYDFIAYENQEIVLTPGMNVRVVCTAVNTSVFVGCFWRERPLEASELV